MRLKNPQRGYTVMKFLLPLLLLGAGILVFQYLINTKPVHVAPMPKEKTWSVQVQPIMAEKLSPEIEVQGRVEAPDRFRAAAPGAGWVESVNIREGDHVGTG